MSAFPQIRRRYQSREASSGGKFAPFILVAGSAGLAVALASLSEALRWTEPGGFKIGLVYGMFLAVVMQLVFLPVQSLLALVLMSRGRRAWWRTLLVLGPAMIVVGGSLKSIAGLYPPEKRARRELPQHLGGSIPPSAADLTMKFTGGMDPSWSFHFHLSPQDYEAICHYREYGPYAYRPDSSSSYPESGDMVWLQSPGDKQAASSIYYLGYDAGKSLCVLTSVNF